MKLKTGDFCTVRYLAVSMSAVGWLTLAQILLWVLLKGYLAADGAE